MVSSVEGIFSLQMENKGLHFRTTLDDKLPNYITGDQQRLRQVLINLVGNAVKFTEKGSVELRVSCAPAKAGHEMISFEVIDTGPGITDAFQLHIFERFRQENDSIERRYGGTGLGTSISQHLVEMMGGRIGVQSIFGKGSRFWFTCPLVRAEKTDFIRDNEVVPAVRPMQLVPGFHARVLVVEDSDMNCHVYRAMFKHLGVETDFAGTGAIALGKLEKEKYDMLVFDMQIPGMSGAETIARYHQIVPLSQRVPVVVITGDATTEIERKCGQLGVQTLLTKPVSIGKISNLVNRYILLKPQECPAQA
jgi:CheY-like chemotaxis protein